MRVIIAALMEGNTDHKKKQAVISFHGIDNSLTATIVQLKNNIYSAIINFLFAIRLPPLLTSR